MKLFKISGNVCVQNIRKWKSNYRIWIVGILLLILVHSYTQDYSKFCNALDVKVSPWIFPFLFNMWHTRILFFAPLLLILCDAPFVDANQPYVIMRSGRKFWSVGQMAYIVFTSAVYFLFIFAAAFLINLPHMEFTMNWGKVLGTLANTNTASAMGLDFFVSSRVLHYFTPFQATWFTFLLSWMCGIFLGMLMYVINSFTNKRSLGVFTAAFFLVLSVSKFPKLNWFSPVNWTNLDNIDIGNMSPNPPISYVLGVYTIVLSLLFILAYCANRKQTINVLQPV